MEIGVSLRGVITGTAIICGVVRLGFGTPIHPRVLFDPVSLATRPAAMSALDQRLFDASAWRLGTSVNLAIKSTR
jgi:hypothetical protein